MNRIIIVGNGFDLAHGVKTSYKDFIEWYLGRVVEELKQNYYYEDKLLEVRLQRIRCSTYETPNYLYSDSFKIEEVIKNIEKDGYIFECLPFLRRIISNIENKGWVDIEADYYEMLKDYALKGQGDVKQLNDELSYIEKKLIEYLTEVERKYLDSSNIQKEFESKIKNIIYEHIAGRDVSINYHRQPRDKEIDKNNRVFLFNFNYTEIADKYIEKEDNFSVIHIHGKLGDEGSVIFGYGDELDAKYKEIEELNNNECLNKVKSVKYLEADNYRKILSIIKTEPYQVYVMGHSCGNSDRTLLNTIFEHENCVSIKPFYYKKSDGTDNYIEIVQNITRNFNDKKLFRDRVVNKTYCKPLPQSEIKQG